MAYNSPTSASHGVIDNLTFGYLANTNKLATVTDAATDSLRFRGFNPGAGGVGYSYDASGNLISDSYKGISNIAYNHLNLPNTINFTSGAKIVFTYTASGKKLKKQVYATNGITINTTIDYLDGIEYLNGKPESIFHPEGRAYNITQSSATPTWRYEYNIKDHLGNNRISFADLNGNGSISNTEILQEQHYYPFGMVQEGAWVNNGGNDDSRYRYNGKEFNGEIGWSDYGARWYDAVVGRWTTVDPNAGKYASITPYNYVYNNPINGFDPDGEDGILIVWPDYKIKLGKRKLSNLGHAGVLLIDNKTGRTKYYEYGRYDPEELGRVNTYSVPDVIMDEDGNPTQASIERTLSVITKKSGQSGRIKGAYVKSDQFEEMNAYAQQVRSNNVNPDRRPYSTLNNNCGTFACDVLNQDPSVNKVSPWIFSPRPVSIIDEWQDNFRPLNFTPKPTPPKPAPKPMPKPEPKPEPKA